MDDQVNDEQLSVFGRLISELQELGIGFTQSAAIAGAHDAANMISGLTDREGTHEEHLVFLAALVGCLRNDAAMKVGRP